jgi:hypothetical protein
MLDVPFRVERSVRLMGGGSSTTSYAIMRTGEGILCWCDDAVFAYRIVDLLNADEASKPSVQRSAAGSAAASG